MNSKGLRLYGKQVEQQIDEYADHIEELEEQIENLESEVTRLGDENNDQCDQIYDLQQQLKAATP